MSSGSQVTIVMGDNRAVFPQGIPASPSEATWIALAAAVNLQYAKLHGYNFEFVQYKGDCTAELSGTSVKRHPAWCKLLALQHASQWKSDAMVIWMDSDAIFHLQNLTVDKYLQSRGLYLPGINPLSSTSVPVTLSKEECSVYMLRDKDHPKTQMNDTANSGVQFWSEPFNHRLLSDWWETNAKNVERDWEQDALNSYVLQNHPREVCVLDDTQPWYAIPDQYIWHHSTEVGADNLTNDEYFQVVFSELSHSNFADLMHDLQGHTVDLQQDALNALVASVAI
jgi:hypothetical protein